MTLADLCPQGYLVAQAWRKWFDSNKPPFCHYEALRAWGERWLALVLHEQPHVERAYDSFATAVLGFMDDPQRIPLPSRNLWTNADNRVLRQITADRAEIAKALGTSERNAGMFVLTAWLQKAEFNQVMRKLVQVNRWLLQAQTQQMPDLLSVLASDPLWRPAIHAEWLLVEVHETKMAELLGTGSPDQNCPTSDDAPAVKPATEAVQEPKAEETTRERGPTLKTQARAKLYKGIKDDHPDWGYDAVAGRANEIERSDMHTGDTVRNTYRAIGWPWQRPDRVR
ncbi:MAG: hypothetical protein Q8P59_05905 [Dehalococcoidia bacterium]|nr:hypothetical protein [Dehalococcoidia bacterium]